MVAWRITLVPPLSPPRSKPGAPERETIPGARRDAQGFQRHIDRERLRPDVKRRAVASAQSRETPFRRGFGPRVGPMGVRCASAAHGHENLGIGDSTDPCPGRVDRNTNPNTAQTAACGVGAAVKGSACGPVNPRCMPTSPRDDSLAALAQDFLTSLYDARPTLAASLGLHEYDGRVPDFGERARAHRASVLRSQGARAAVLAQAVNLARDDRHDLALLRAAVEEELFELESLRDYERNPLAYAAAIDVSNYVKRDYAPLDRRVAALTEHLRQVPDVLAAARAALRPPLPRPFVDTALEVYAGAITFHEGQLPAAVHAAGDAKVRAAFDQANAVALEALRSFVHYLGSDARAGAIAEFAIGEERFRTMLRTGEMVNIELDRLLEVGRRDLAHNTERLRAVCETAAPGLSIRDAIKRQSSDHPPANRLIDEAARVLEELRAFVERAAIVTIPSAVRCRVEPTPPFLRWYFAMMDVAGPFESSSESFYYVTPPEPGWSAEQTEEWLMKFDYGTLRGVGIHEVYPGHYVHLLHVRGISGRPLRQVLRSYAFDEGWAHDCEQLMLEQGFGEDDGALRIAQASGALLRDVRLIAAIEMHTRGMRVEDATRLFVDHAYLEPLPAEKEAVRGTFDPGYLNYTLGKLMLRRLRDDVRARAGARFDLRAFHDTLLRLGAPQVPLARQTLLGGDAEALV
jgi:uncharacterized protein (DUF885 family)